VLIEEEGDIGAQISIYFKHGMTMQEQFNDYDKAIEYFEKALALNSPTGKSIEDQSWDIGMEMRIHFALHKAYRSIDEPRRALDHLEKGTELEKEVSSQLTKKEVLRLQALYDADNREQRIEHLEAESANESALRWTIVGSAAILLSLLSFFFYHRNKVQKDLLRSEFEIERQNALLEGQMDERNRLARELHDGLGGLLASIKMDLQAEVMDGTLEQEHGLIGKVSGACEQIREISHELVPKSIHDRQFTEVLESLLAQYSRQLTIGHEFYPKERINAMSIENKKHVHRILQELMTNIVKHAEAARADVNLLVTEEAIGLLVVDDGVGMTQSTDGEGIGHHNILTRLKSLKGMIDIQSSHGGGTSISISIPN